MAKIVNDLMYLPALVESVASTKSQLVALTPHDGRYARAVVELTNFCSEAGLQRLRVLVEVEYLLYSNNISAEVQDNLRGIYREFSIEDAARIKEIERKINHDVKAVEYFICEKLDALNYPGLKSEVHIFLTSEDVTNVAIGLMVHASLKILFVEIDNLFTQLSAFASQWKDMPMLARTHGQPASPTTVGKEFAIFANRVDKVGSALTILPIEVKWNGATGNYNAHAVSDRETDWIAFSQSFITNHLGLKAELYTGQTSNYLYLADIFHQLKNLSSILIDLSRDMWLYISYDNFKLKLKDGEVGSSVMPHKVNPIDFENAEGNLEFAECLFGFMASKLQKSRMQRDLSDSTTLRNLGLTFGSCLIGMKSVSRGLSKIDINRDQLRKDLENNPQVISEAIQSTMRYYGIDNAYEQLKEITRGQAVTMQLLRHFIRNQTKLPDDVRKFLIQLTPAAYTGLAKDLVDHFLKNRI